MGQRKTEREEEATESAVNVYERNRETPRLKEGMRAMVGAEGWSEAKEGKHPTIFHCPRSTSTTFDCFRL